MAFLLDGRTSANADRCSWIETLVRLRLEGAPDEWCRTRIRHRADAVTARWLQRQVAGQALIAPRAW
jgi:hypothetical protein